MAMYTQQPGAVPQMHTGGNRNALNKPTNASGQREWSHGLCDCFGDCGTCVVSSLLPCVIYSQNKTRLEHLERQGYPHPTGGESFGGDCCIYYLVAGLGCHCILQMGVRGNIRARYRIEGSGFGDCCTAYCCTPCELTQESRELELEERSMVPAKAA